MQCSAVRAALCVFLLFLPLWFVWGAPEMRAAGVASGRGSSVCGVPPLLPSDLLPCRSLPSFHRLQSIKVSPPCKSKKSQQQQRQWHSSATTAKASLRVLLPVPHILYPLTVFWQNVECCHRIGIGIGERERERERERDQFQENPKPNQTIAKLFWSLCKCLLSMAGCGEHVAVSWDQDHCPPQREREREISFRKTLTLIRRIESSFESFDSERDRERELSLNPLQMAAVHDRMWRTCCGQLKSRPLPPEMLNPFFSHHPTTTTAAANLIKCLMCDQSGNGKRHM